MRHSRRQLLLPSRAVPAAVVAAVGEAGLVVVGADEVVVATGDEMGAVPMLVQARLQLRLTRSLAVAAGVAPVAVARDEAPAEAVAGVEAAVLPALSVNNTASPCGPTFPSATCPDPVSNWEA